MARIRTIKPEFWQDEKLAKLPLPARLLFIGLWTLADDSGVLRGSEMFVKSQLFPYDDMRTSEVRKWIDALVDARMLIPLEFKEESYLYIRTFRDHQRINRPSETRNIDEETLLFLLETDDSCSTHVVLTEGSHQEREREREREKEGDTCVGARGEVEKKLKKNLFPIESEVLKEQWARWKAYKAAEHRFKFKSIDSEQSAIKGLLKIAGDSEKEAGGIENAIKLIVEKAIMNGWKGLFPLKKEDYENNRQRNSGLNPGGFEPAVRDSYGNL